MLVLFVSYLDARTWTSKSGTNKIEAEYVGVEGDNVLLRKQDGTLAKPKIELLSIADQDYIKTKQKSDEQDIFATVPEEKTTTAKKPENSLKLTAKDGSSAVTVNGTGSTFEEAKKDAFRNAITKVVGTLINAQTRVTRGGIIEQMLTASNAYIEEHRILSRKQKDGMWEITMEAVVESRAVEMRLSPPTEEVIEIDGSSIAGKLQAQNKSDDAAVLLLAKALKDSNYPYSVMEVSAKMEKDPVKKEGNSVTMRVNVTVKANAEKFDEFRKKIEPILDKIAISKNNMTLKMIKDRDNYQLGSLPYSIPGRIKGSLTFLHFNTSRINNLMNTGWKSYELPNKARAILLAYVSVIPCIEIEVCNAAGNAIVTDSFPPSYTSYDRHEYLLSCSISNHGSPGINGKSVNAGSSLDTSMNYISDYFFSPFFHVANDYYNGGTKFISEGKISRELPMNTSDLNAIKNIKCRIDPQNRAMDAYYEKLPEILKNWKEVK
ncbi:MAG: hypothetical protein LBK82_07815 [Planctomycetaceae bacterium]|nr:hypothetical protein [Planctomycetaceae bacterium]